MTNAKHTPGPWSVFEDGPDTFVMTGKLPSYPSYNICHVQNHNQRADGRLIASAPELLEALKVSLDMLNQLLAAAEQDIVPDISIGFFKNRTQIIEPAIAKAEGN